MARSQRVPESDGEWPLTHRNSFGNIPDNTRGLVLYPIDEEFHGLTRPEDQGDMMLPTIINGNAAVDLGTVPRIVG